jgi:spermidine/putrescine-binding protein
MDKYFYIITRDGQIFEIENIENRFIGAMERWQNSGIVVFSTLGIALNTADISKILNQDQYEVFVDSAQPKMFIRNGAWYTSSDRSKPIRYEKWKQLELDSRKKLEAHDKEPTEEQKERIKKLREEMNKRWGSSRDK